MKSIDLRTPGLAVLGRGEAEGSSCGLEVYRALGLDRVKPKKVHFADVAAWATVGAVGQACASIEDMSAVERERSGIVLVSEYGPMETMAAVAKSARENRMSALRFPAATPGSLVGLICIVFGLRGPTLNLTMPPASGIPVAAVVANNWLKQGVVDFVLLVTCQQGPVARCLLVGQQQGVADGDLSWLLIGNGMAQLAQKGAGWTP